MPEDKVEIKITTTADKAGKDIKSFTDKAARGFQKVKGASDKTNRGFQRLSHQTSALKTRFLSLKTALGGLVAGFVAYKAIGVAKSFLDVASSVENYRIRLSTLLGGQKAANEAMEFFNDIAAKTPATLGEVIEAGTTLTAMGADYKKWIPVLNDLAAVMGMKMPAAASALGRAYAGGAGAADIFRERGILQVIKDFAKMKHGIDDITQLTLPEFRKIMLETFTDPQGKIAGAGAALSKSWDGMISMLADAWFRFRQKVMDTDVFQTLKLSLGRLLELIEKWKKEGRLDEWARQVAEGTLSAFETIAIGAGYVVDAFRGWKMIFKGVEGAWLMLRHAVDEGMAWLLEKAGKENWTQIYRDDADRMLRKLEEVNQEIDNIAARGRAAQAARNLFADIRKELEESKKKLEEQKKAQEEAEKTTEKQKGHMEIIAAEAGKAKGNFSKIKTTVNQISLQRLTDEAKELNQQLQEIKKRLQEIEAAKRKAKEGAGAVAMRLGGVVGRGYQGGGPLPGYGGGDRIPGLLEPGEYVLRKEAVRKYGADFIDALNRMALPKVSDRVVWDIRLGEESYPVNVEASDAFYALVDAIKRSRLMQG